MATRKTVIIKTATQLESAGYTLQTDDLDNPFYKNGSDEVSGKMFKYLGQSISGTISDTSSTGNQGLLEHFPASSWQSTTSTVDHAPGLEGHQITAESGEIIHITVFQDASMNVRYRNTIIHVPSAGVTQFQALMAGLGG